MESIGNLLYLENLRGPDLEPVLEAPAGGMAQAAGLGQSEG